jgi:hypothetical protein
MHCKDEDAEAFEKTYEKKCSKQFIPGGKTEKCFIFIFFLYKSYI